MRCFRVVVWFFVRLCVRRVVLAERDVVSPCLSFSGRWVARSEIWMEACVTQAYTSLRVCSPQMGTLGTVTGMTSKMMRMSMMVLFHSMVSVTTSGAELRPYLGLK